MYVQIVARLKIADIFSDFSQLCQSVSQSSHKLSTAIMFLFTCL